MNNQNLSSSYYSTFWPQEVTLTEKLWGSKEDPLKTNNQVDQYPQAEEKSRDAEEKDVLVQPDLSSGSVRQHNMQSFSFLSLIHISEPTRRA